MSRERDTVAVVLGAIVVMLLQFILAPVIRLSSSQPNFLLAYVLVISIVRPAQSGLILPFVLGILYDLSGCGPVGGMAFLFVLVSFICQRLFTVLDNDTLFMPLTTFALGALVVEVFYGVLLIVLGLSANVVEVFIYRALPCALYDCAVGLVFYPLAIHLFGDNASWRGIRAQRLR